MIYPLVHRIAIAAVAGSLLGGCFLFPDPGFHTRQLSPYNHEIMMALSATPRNNPEETVSRLAFGLCGRAFRFEEPYVRPDEEGEPERVWPITCL